MKTQIVNFNTYRPAKTNFKAADKPKNNDNPKIEITKKKNSGCFSSSLYWIMLLSTLSSPLMKKCSDDKLSVAYEEKCGTQENTQNYLDLRNNFFGKKPGASAAYQLESLYETDWARFEKQSENEYFANFSLEDKEIRTQILLDPKNKNKITGSIIYNDADRREPYIYDYKAYFSDKNKERFDIYLTSYENKQEKTTLLSLKREWDGALYLIKNGKKILLNGANQEHNFETKKLIEENEEKSSENESSNTTIIMMLIWTLIRMYDLKERNKEDS